MQRVGVEHERHLTAGEQLVAQAQRLRRASEPRADRDRARLGEHRARRPSHLHGLQRAVPRPPAATARARRPSRSRRRRERPRPARQIAPVMPGGRRRRAPSPALYLLSSARLRGTSDRTSGRDQPHAVVGVCSSPMSATTTSPAWKRPGATASPTLQTVERHGDASLGLPSPGNLAGRRVDARGDVDGDHRCRCGVDPLDRRRRLGARLAVEARAEQRVDDHVGLARRQSSPTASQPSVRAGSVAAIRPSPPFAPPPQTTAIRCASGRAAAPRGRPPAPARLHQLGAVSSRPSSAARISAAV